MLACLVALATVSGADLGHGKSELALVMGLCEMEGGVLPSFALSVL